MRAGWRQATRTCWTADAAGPARGYPCGDPCRDPVRKNTVQSAGTLAVSFFSPALGGTLTGSGHRGLSSSPSVTPRSLRAKSGSTQSLTQRRCRRPQSWSPSFAGGAHSLGLTLCATPSWSRTCDGEVLVPGLGHVQAVRIPHPRIVERVEAPVVHQHRLVPRRHLADPLVVDGVPPLQRFQQRRDPDVEAGEQHHCGPARGKPGDEVLVVLHQGADVGPEVQDVVPARVQGNKGGFHGQRGFELFGDDLPQPLAADGEVGVLPPRIRPGQLLRHPVRPAAHPVRAAGSCSPPPPR